MNGYMCFWNGKRVEVHAVASFAAQQAALPEFQRIAGRKKVKRQDITAVLCEKAGEQVTHTPA